jgi:hypothetical protein
VNYFLGGCKWQSRKIQSLRKKFPKGIHMSVEVVDEPCGCEDDFALMCCGEPMKEKKLKAKAAK